MAECLFCQIVAGEKPANIVFRDNNVLAFKDIHPRAPVHVLIIPKKHIRSLADISGEDFSVICHMMEAANIIARQQGTAGSFKLVINTGKEAGQVIMHLHMHLLGGNRFHFLV